MKRTAIDIHCIHTVITENLLDGLIKPVLSNDLQIRQFQENGFLTNLSGSTVFRVETSIKPYIKNICSENNIHLSENELHAWAELYTTLIAPYDKPLRDECLKAISLHEISFISLFGFFSHWVRVQFRLLHHGDNDAVKLINNKLDMFSLTSSKQIPQSMRHTLIAYALQRSQNLFEKKHIYKLDESSQTTIYYVQTPIYKDDQKHSAIGRLLADPIATRYLMPSNKVIGLKNSQDDSLYTQAPSLPLLLYLNRIKDGDYIKDLDSIDLRPFNLDTESYRVACAMCMMPIFKVINKTNSLQKAVSGKDDSYIYMFYVGLMDEITLLCVFGFDLSFNTKAENNADYMQYTPYSLTELEINDRPKKQFLPDELFIKYAQNIFNFYMYFTQDNGALNPVFSLGQFTSEEALDFIKIDIRKIAAILNVEYNAVEVLEQCEKHFVAYKGF